MRMSLAFLSLEQLGFLSGIITDFNWKHPFFFMDSGEDHVKEMRRVHPRTPITDRGQSLRIERTENLPHSLVLVARPFGPGKPFP